MSDRVLPANERQPVLSSPGMILVGPATNQVLYNSEAVKILSYPNALATPKRINTLVNEKIGEWLNQRSATATENDFAVMEFSSGRRHYRCTRYALNMPGLQGMQAVVILFERTNSPDVTIQELCEGLHLTLREREAVGLLVRGLTSKEIAQHMGISPNTVKSFLRLVMTKAGVSTRTGLIGRVAGIVPRSPTTLPAAISRKNTEYAGFSRSIGRSA